MTSSFDVKLLAILQSEYYSNIAGLSLRVKYRASYN